MRRRQKFNLPNSSLEISIFSDISAAELKSGAGGQRQRGERRFRTDLHSRRAAAEGGGGGGGGGGVQPRCSPVCGGYLSTPSALLNRQRPSRRARTQNARSRCLHLARAGYAKHASNDCFEPIK